MSQQCWHPCAICRAATQEAIAGNRLLSCWEVARLPAEGAPTVSWRCKQHQRYQMRPASAVWATAQGDLCFALVCGHTAHWVLRGRWGYTPELVEQGLATGRIQLTQRHRCYQCGTGEPAPTPG